MKPIKKEQISIRKCEQLSNRLLIAIDGGKVFTKVLFLNKTNKEHLFNDDKNILKFELSSFYSDRFDEALKYIQDNAYMPDDKSYKIHITGSYVFQHQNQIKSILKRNVNYLDEFQTIAVGCKFALENIGVDNMLAKPVEVESYGEIDSGLIRIMEYSWKKKFSDKEYSNSTFHPCLFYVQGDSSGYYYFNETGYCKYFETLHSRCQTLLGLSKCLSNINDLNELIDLASRGDKIYVDSQIKDLINDNINTPYGKIPFDMPLFSFGKCEDNNIGLEDLRKEDVANSVVGHHINNIMTAFTSISESMRVPKLYVCGGIFESDVCRKELKKLLNVPFILVNPEILDFDYSAILGAMVFEESHLKVFH